MLGATNNVIVHNREILCQRLDGQEFPQKFELYGQHELWIGPWLGFPGPKRGLTPLQKGFDGVG